VSSVILACFSGGCWPYPYRGRSRARRNCVPRHRDSDEALKSHTLASLFHAARNRKWSTVWSRFTYSGDSRLLDCRENTKGKEIPGEKYRAQTIWGWIAWSLGGKKSLF